jgi:hypothetical protein
MPAKQISAKKLRQKIIARARGYCEYCRCPDSCSGNPYSVDHILPRAKGGKTTLSNLAYACQGCNGKKSDKTKAVDPLTLRSAKLFHPRKQSWAEHFFWNQDFTLIVGRTETGRATVVALDMNRLGNVNLRRLLRGSKQHPPQD